MQSPPMFNPISHGGVLKGPQPPSKNNHYAIILHTKHDYIFSDFKDMVIWQLLVKKCEIFFGVLPFSPLKWGQPGKMTTQWLPMTPTFDLKILSYYQNEDVDKKNQTKKYSFFFLVFGLCSKTAAVKLCKNAFVPRVAFIGSFWVELIIHHSFPLGHKWKAYFQKMNPNPPPPPLSKC